MNEEFAVRLSDLRAAADAMQRGTVLIRASVDTVRGELAGLAAQLNPQTTPVFGHLIHSTRIVELTDTLDRLSHQLTRTANDVDNAARWQGPPLGVLWDRIHTRPARIITDATPPPTAAYTLGSYISRSNRPLYDALLADKDALATEQANIAKLAAARHEAAAERDALRDRQLVYGVPQSASAARMQALDRQIMDYDREIHNAEARANTLEIRIEAATDRLIAVNPADNADVYLIRSFEGADSAPYVLSNTRDCVNYIASRVAIPGELAANAHLWDERATELTQFGIRIGDTPLAGAVLVMEADHPYADDRYGHVLLVEHVDSSGGVWVTDNNHATPVRLSDLTTETTGDRVKYLYLPWYTRA